MTQALSAVLRGLFPPALPEQHSTWPVFPWPLLLTLISSTCFAVQFSSQKLACLCASFSRGKPRHKNVCSLSQGCTVAKNRSESMTLCHPRPPLEQLDTYAWACTGMARKNFFDPFFYLTEIENDMLWLRITEHKLQRWFVFEELEDKSPRTAYIFLKVSKAFRDGKSNNNACRWFGFMSHSQFSKGSHCIQKSRACNFSEAARVGQGCRIWGEKLLLCLFLMRK